MRSVTRFIFYFYFLVTDVQLLKRLSFPHFIAFVPSKISCLYISLFLVSVLFCWSLFLSLGKYYAVLIVVLLTKSCLTLCDPRDCTLPGSSVHGILQARVLEWVTISFSRGPSQPRDRTHVPLLAGGFFTTEPPEKSRCLDYGSFINW